MQHAIRSSKKSCPHSFSCAGSAVSISSMCRLQLFPACLATYCSLTSVPARSGCSSPLPWPVWCGRGLQSCGRRLAALPVQGEIRCTIQWRQAQLPSYTCCRLAHHRGCGRHWRAVPADHPCSGSLHLFAALWLDNVVVSQEERPSRCVAHITWRLHPPSSVKAPWNKRDNSPLLLYH